MDCTQIDFTKMFLMSERGGYRITYNMKKLAIKTPIVFSPFGVELYNKKEVLNIEIQKLGNEQQNFTHGMNMIDVFYNHFSDESLKETNQIPFTSPQVYAILAKELNGKAYTSFLRDSNKGKHVRTHITKNTDIYKMVDGKKIYATKSEIKGKQIICEMELSNIWYYGVAYGLTWNMTKIEIL